MKSSLENAHATSYTHIKCNLPDGKLVAEIISDIENDISPIDTLVHNAHQLMIKPFMETTPDDLASVWQNSCFGAMNVATQQFHIC